MSNILITYEQSSSSGGPFTFYEEEGTDGQHFSHSSLILTVHNGNWNPSVHNITNTVSINMGGLTDLNNQRTVYFRITDDDLFYSADDRLDNVLVQGTRIPPPPLVLPSAHTTAGYTTLTVTWTNNGSLCHLEQSGSLAGGWTLVSNPWTTNAKWISVSLTNTAPAQFYRLRES